MKLEMSFLKKLNDTYELLNKLDNIIMKNGDNNLEKKCLLSVTEDLAKYKDIDAKNTKFDKDEIKSKIKLDDTSLKFKEYSPSIILSEIIFAFFSLNQFG